MNTIIRRERIEDYKIVEEVAREAFWNLYFPGCHEHYVIHNIRDHSDFLKDLSFVIELNYKIIGAIFYTKSKIILDDDRKIDTISFGPVFIHPKYHRQGFGKKLITHSIEAAKNKGYRAIITLGYPYHYSCYGFKSGKTYNISMEDKKYYKGLLVLPLYKGALDNISGYALFSNALDSDQKRVDEFDKFFPYKEKKYQESQKEFEIACSLLDE